MTKDELEQRIRELNVWRRHDERAPHKPLLVLYALGRALRGESREVPYVQVDKALRELLIQFGPPRQTVHPEYPFWRLQQDGLWSVSSDDVLLTRRGNTDPKKSELIAKNARGGFEPEVQELVRGRPEVAHRLANLILEAHFPETMHEDILAAVGLDVELAPTPVTQRAGRSPSFRSDVLTAYEQRCAVCGFDVRLGTAQIGLDGAHIKWRQAGGPDIVQNGLALCVLHHKLFDRGVFMIDSERRLILSQRVTGNEGFHAVLVAFHGQKVREPVSRRYAPHREFLAWHEREVFLGPGRDTEDRLGRPFSRED